MNCATAEEWVSQLSSHIQLILIHESHKRQKQWYLNRWSQQVNTTDITLYKYRAACRQHNTEQDSDYQQLHNDRTIYYWHIWQKLTT